MSTQNQIIVICILGAIAVPLGTFITIKTIHKLTRPVVNTMNRSGDIELMDYNEPTQLQQAHYDLLSPPLSTDFIQFMPDTSMLSYYERGTSSGIGNPSGSLPSYHSVYINSVSENGINLDYILWLVLFLIISVLIINFKNNFYKNKILSKFIVLYSLCFIFFFMLISWKSLYAMAILIPFCSFDIDFRDSFEWKLFPGVSKHEISYLKIQTLTRDITKMLDTLTDDENYSMSLSFISSYKDWQANKEKVDPIWIDDAIIINRESDPILITQFIMNGIHKERLLKSDWLDNYLINLMDPVILIVIVRIKVKI